MTATTSSAAPSVAGVGEAGDVAERVVLVGGIRALARAGALVEARSVRQRREDGGGAGGVGGLGAGVDVAQHVAVLRSRVNGRPSLSCTTTRLKRPLTVKPVGEVVAHDGAVEGTPTAGCRGAPGDRGVAQGTRVPGGGSARAGVGEGETCRSAPRPRGRRRR